MTKQPFQAAAAAFLLALAVAGLSSAADAQTDPAAAEAADIEAGETLSPEEFQEKFSQDALDRAFGLSEMLILPAKLSVVIGRGDSLYVRNQSSEARDFRVIVADLGEHEDYEDARDYVRYGPRQFTLKPEETQIVRLFARRPPQDGKPHRLRLAVQLLPLTLPVLETDTDQIRTSFSAIYAVSVPIDLIN